MEENHAHRQTSGSPESSPHSDNSNNNNNNVLSNIESNTSSSSNNNNNREHDRFLPIANVGRIMKKAIPSNGKVSKDAKETVQECVSEFISFVTGETSDKCQREKRKTINGDDIIWALTMLGFDDYINPLKLYVHKYRELEGEKLTVPKQEQSQQQRQQQQYNLLSFDGSQPSLMYGNETLSTPFSPNAVQQQQQGRPWA